MPTESREPARAAAATAAAMSLPALRRLVAAMPKAELHLHLDGALRVDTALDLARSRRVDAPRTWAGMHAVLAAAPGCSSQAELLTAFDLPIALLQDAAALERVARELVEAKAADRVRYLEVRWAPLLHTARGLSPAGAIAAVADGAAEGARASGATVRLIATAMRSHEPAANLELARLAAGFRDRGLVGFDLAGPEEAHPDAAVHRGALAAARDAGLHLTIHAGEWGGAAQVRAALDLGPERIAHGAPAIDDLDLCAELRRRGVSLDLCPTSNVQAGVVASLADHPLAALHRGGVPVTLSTDDPTVSDLTLSEEYLNAVTRIGLTLPELWTVDRRALEVAFADETALAPLRAELAAWGGGIPELGPAAGEPYPGPAA